MSKTQQPTFRVCLEGDERWIDTACEINSWNSDEAAALFVEKHFSHLDYPTEIDVFVKRMGHDHSPLKFRVSAIHEVRFKATLCESCYCLACSRERNDEGERNDNGN